MRFFNSGRKRVLGARYISLKDFHLSHPNYPLLSIENDLSQLTLICESKPHLLVIKSAILHDFKKIQADVVSRIDENDLVIEGFFDIQSSANLRNQHHQENMKHTIEIPLKTFHHCGILTRSEFRNIVGHVWATIFKQRELMREKPIKVPHDQSVVPFVFRR